ncbi:MAG: restriction endonuclease subunit S [Bacteroidetes bacterium]|nr:restriction endonuclease subunit S [Bacteroidota bacterium]
MLLAIIEYGISSPIDKTLRKGIRILSLPNVDKNGDFVLDKTPFIEKEKVSENDYLKYGDLLFNWRNGSKEHLGKTAFFNLNGVYTHVGFLLKIRTYKDKLNPFFLKSYINFLRNNGFFLRAKIQVNNTFNKQELSELPVIFPDILEQQKIAAILSTWDKAIELTQQLIEVKEEQKKGLMQRLFSPKESLQEYTYGQIIKEVKRPIEWDDDERYDLISVRRRSGGLFHRDTLYGHQIKTKNLRTANKGDFLISKMQILHGASGLTTEEFDGMKISGSYIGVISKNPRILNIEYLNWLSKTPWFYHQTYISSYGVHIEKMTFDFKSFLKQHVYLPSIEEQKKAVSILNLAEKEIKGLKRKCDALREQKKGLMQQLLTGKIRVNQ